MYVLSRFVKSKKHSLNLLCVLDHFSECWQSTLFHIFLVSELVVLGQPQRTIGLKETFMRNIVEMTNKAETDWKNRVRKWRVVGRIHGMKYN